VLPARFARLPGTVAIILGREPATLGISAASTAATTAAIAVPVAIKSATATAPTASARSTAAATGRGLGARLVDFQSSSTDFLAVKARHRLCGFSIVGHLDKRKSACSACFPVHSDVNSSDLSEWFKECAQLRFRRLKTHVPDKNILHNYLSFQVWESAERAASMAGFRSHLGDGEDRMKSRGVDKPNAPEGKENPDSHIKHNNYIRLQCHFR
jgi:hypothetical protein